MPPAIKRTATVEELEEALLSIAKIRVEIGLRRIGQVFHRQKADWFMRLSDKLREHKFDIQKALDEKLQEEGAKNSIELAEPEELEPVKPPKIKYPAECDCCAAIVERNTQVEYRGVVSIQGKLIEGDFMTYICQSCEEKVDAFF